MSAHPKYRDNKTKRISRERGRTISIELAAFDARIKYPAPPRVLELSAAKGKLLAHLREQGKLC